MRPWLLALAGAVGLIGFATLTAPPAHATEITVNTAADQNGGSPGECSLREAMLAALLNAVVDGCAAGQAGPAVDVIKFNIGGGGVQTITINKIDNNNVGLPEILDPLIIDGTTQPGFAGTPLIELRRGTGPGMEGVNALFVGVGVSGYGGHGSVIKGLAISDWSQRTGADTDHDDPARGIRVDAANNVTIQGNWFGLRANGTEGGGNAADLTIINGAQNTQVGGSTAAARNIFVGTSPGVNPDSISISGATTTGTRIQGNYFGLTPAGTATLSGASIVLSSGASSTLIGGPAAAERNVIAVSITEFSGSGTGTQIIGNYIGVNANGAPLTSSAGITIGAANSTIRGNILRSATVGGSGTTVQGNLIGLAPDGTTVIPGAGGLGISGTGLTVGGTAAADRNVIANSSSNGLSISGTNHIVKGNYIGTDATGQVARPNANGVLVGGTGQQVGGAGAGEGNVISGNTGYGVQITGSGHTIAGNRIGVAADGTTALGNGGRGITFNSGSSDPLTIGGTTTGAGNLIANNGAQGIRNDWSTRQRVSILGNSIHSNGSLGIMLGFGPNPLPNDAGDGDTGSNNKQNYPVLTSAVAGSGTTIAGTLNSTSSTNNYRIELFSNPACDGSGFGEGRTFLGSTTLNTDSSGNGSFGTTVPTTLAVGTQVTATATDPLGNTSEFSQCFASTGGGGTPAGFTVTPTSGLVTTEAGGQATFTVKLNTVPTSAVTIALSSSDTTEGTVSPSSLTFQPNSTALNAQTVTVTGVNDLTIDGTVAYTVVTGAASSSDPAFNGVNPPDVSVSNSDNDVACSFPRPNVIVTSTKGVTGVLNVTVQAGQGGIGKIDFGASRPIANASISVAGGPQNQTSAFSFSPTNNPAAVQFTITSPNRSLPTTVPLTIVDACGSTQPWQTFVGGGAGSF
jgi:CSLREA domain-containing protein